MKARKTASMMETFSVKKVLGVKGAPFLCILYISQRIATDAGKPKIKQKRVEIAHVYLLPANLSHKLKSNSFQSKWNAEMFLVRLCPSRSIFGEKKRFWKVKALKWHKQTQTRVNQVSEVKCSQSDETYCTLYAFVIWMFISLVLLGPKMLNICGSYSLYIMPTGINHNLTSNRKWFACFIMEIKWCSFVWLMTGPLLKGLTLKPAFCMLPLLLIEGQCWSVITSVGMATLEQWKVVVFFCLHSCEVKVTCPWISAKKT